MTSATSPLDSSTTLRAEMRERLQCALEAMTKRLAPDLARLAPDDMAAVLAVELTRLVDAVEAEHLHRLAELAAVSQGEDPDPGVGGAK